MHFVEGIEKLGACEDAVEWCETQPDLETAWRVCHRGDWMLWLAGKLSGPPGDGRKKLVACAMEVPMLARQYASPDVQEIMDRCERAVSAWIDGSGTLEDVRRAAVAADDVADVYYAASAAYAAYAACDVYYAASKAAAYAAAAAYATDDVYYAASKAAAYAAAAVYAAYAACDVYYYAKAKTLSLAADIVRRHYPVSPEFP
jgi:hypothetical protein